MIKNIDGERVLYCDECGKTFSGFKTFNNVRKFGEHEGWTVVKRDAKFYNYCEICSAGDLFEKRD